MINVGMLLALVSTTTVGPAAGAPTGMMTLNQALEIARANLPALRQARPRTDEARGLRDEAGAARYPTVTVNLAYRRTTGNFAVSPGITPTAAIASTPTLNTFNYYANGISVAQLLCDFGQTSNRVAATKETVRSQEETERVALLQAELAVRTAFFTAAAQNALVSVAMVNLDNNETHLAG